VSCIWRLTDVATIFAGKSRSRHVASFARCNHDYCCSCVLICFYVLDVRQSYQIRLGTSRRLPFIRSLSHYFRLQWASPDTLCAAVNESIPTTQMQRALNLRIACLHALAPDGLGRKKASRKIVRRRSRNGRYRFLVVAKTRNEQRRHLHEKTAVQAVMSK